MEENNKDQAPAQVQAQALLALLQAPLNKNLQE